MKKSYLIRSFDVTLSERFPKKAGLLYAAFAERLNALRLENAGASDELLFHLERQILPGIAIYETLQRVMDKDEALKTVHGYVEEHAKNAKKLFLFLLHIPGLYKKSAGDIFKTGAAAFRRGGRLCRERDKDLARRLADRHDKMPISRLLRKIRLSGALPLRRSEQRRVVTSLGSSFRHRINPFH